MWSLLTLAVRPRPGNSCPPASVLPWDHVTDQQFRYVIEGGLGPLLFNATEDTLDEAPAAWRDTLRSSDLTARVRHGNLTDATLEILDACRGAGIPVTLLKGISIADQLYPAGHLRPMGDIDLLVAEQDCAWLESAALRLGYVPKAAYEPDNGDPHRAPLFHPKREVWIEVHTALFPSGDRLQADTLFSSTQIAGQEIASMYHGRPANRLTREMQLVYVASYWIRDLCRNPLHPSFVIPMVDTVYLLRAFGREPDWEEMFRWLDNELAIASLYLMLSCLAATGLAPSLTPVLSRLASRQRIVAEPELRIIRSMIDANLIEGQPFLGRFGVRHPMIALSILRGLLLPGSHIGKLLAMPFNVFFPPWIPDRYSVRYQIGRIRRFLRT